jgi:DNA repair protein RadA/Sms
MEFVCRRARGAGAEGRAASSALGSGRAHLYDDVQADAAVRVSSGISEFDRVLGGGIVPGSLVLLGGEPGIGKSTLLLQAAANFARTVGPVLYCSGEESEHQIKMRGERLGVGQAPLFLLAETCVERLIDEVERVKPSLLIVDSIQTVFSLKLQSAPGACRRSVKPPRTCCLRPRAETCRRFSSATSPRRKSGRTQGAGARRRHGAVLRGPSAAAHRIVRAVKNRFGAVSELGVFEMTATGLRPVPNPSALFLAERPANVPGSSVFCAIEGSRPMLVEVQALVSASTFGNPRRMASGLDPNRLSLLLAVLDKRAGLNLAADDVFVNVAGGMTIEEPAADLAVLAAVASSLRNRPIPSDIVVFGEVGLAGEVRSIAQAALRAREAAQLGFRRCLMPIDAWRRPMRRPVWRSSASAPSAKPSTPCCSIRERCWVSFSREPCLSPRSCTRRGPSHHRGASDRQRGPWSRDCARRRRRGARLRETAVTSLLGGLLGFGVGLWLANTIVGALSWSNTSNTQVQFVHGLIVVVCRSWA